VVREFLAERYESGVTREKIKADAVGLAAAVDQLRAEGHEIEFIGSTFFPGDEACLSRFMSSSADLVAAAHRRASVAFERVVEGVDISGRSESREQIRSAITAQEGRSDERFTS
jgi:hypothetical protein